MEEVYVGAERGINCEHMQALVTNILQRHWEWQEDGRIDLQPGRYRYNTAFMASLSVKAAFIKDSHPERCTRTSDGGIAGRDARFSWLREL